MKLRRGLLRDYGDWYGHPYWLTYLCTRLTSYPTRFAVRGKNMSHPVTLRTGTTDLAMFNSVFTTPQYDVPLSRQPGFILDCGGNVGFAAIWFANTYPDARIVCVEPEAENYGLLLRNIAPYPNIVPIHGAVWREDTILQVIDVGLGHCGFETQSLHTPTENRHGTTPAYSIPTLMLQFSVEDIDFLKVDIEGAEGELLETIPPWLSRVHVLAVEFHDDKHPGLRGRFDLQVARFFSHTARCGENILYASPGWAGLTAAKSPWQPLTPA